MPELATPYAVPLFDSKEEDSDPDSGSNATDDGMADVLEDQPNDATQQELAEFIRGLDVDEQVELVALAWVGRGTWRSFSGSGSKGSICFFP